MEKRYGNCVCHNRYSSLNAKGLCPEGARERHKKSAESKGFKVKEYGIDRNTKTEAIQDKEFSFEGNGVKGETTFKKAKINRVSENKAKENAELARLKKAKILELGEKCEMCPRHGSVDLFHIIGVGDKTHATNPKNLLLSCRWCHLIWGANDFEKILKFNNFDDIMNRLKDLDSGKYWKFRHKIEKHVIEKYFETKDKTDMNRLGIKFVSPL
jgi:hypothetical protein